MLNMTWKRAFADMLNMDWKRANVNMLNMIWKCANADILNMNWGHAIERAKALELLGNVWKQVTPMRSYMLPVGAIRLRVAQRLGNSG